MLQDDCNVEVYVYVTSTYTLFHPKIYFGKLNALAWAMVGSSTLTKRGLSWNVEQNLFIMGQRHKEPFISIEAQIAAFCSKAYLFDADIEKELVVSPFSFCHMTSSPILVGLERGVSHASIASIDSAVGYPHSRRR
jgi:hypothetical protein